MTRPHSHSHGCRPRGGFGAHLFGLFAMGQHGAGFGAGFGDGFGDSFDRGFAGRGGPRGPRHRRRMFDSGELRLVLLKLLADEPRHGYDLIRAIEDLTGGDYAPSPGTVYPTLTLLEDMGLIAPVETDGSNRKAFAATDTGRAHLDERADEVAGLISRLKHHGKKRSRADRAPVHRAMHGLHSALWGSVTAGDVSDEQVHTIAEILDEATRKIERLG